MEAESASLAEGTDLLIVAAPREAKLQTFVLILNPEAVPDGRESVSGRERILRRAGQVDHGRSEDRPIAPKQHPAGKPQLLPVAEILDRRIDVPVQPQIADLK